MGKKSAKTPSNVIIENRKARHDFDMHERMEAGMVLEGWELKALRKGRVQLVDSYVILKNGEAFLLGSHINPLESASTHVRAEPDRTRKLLLHHEQLKKLIGATQRKGFTIVCTQIYWKKHLIKATIALAKGRKTHDKRAAIKERDWQRSKHAVLKGG